MVAQQSLTIRPTKAKLGSTKVEQLPPSRFQLPAEPPGLFPADSHITPVMPLRISRHLIYRSRYSLVASMLTCSAAHQQEEARSTSNGSAGSSGRLDGDLPACYLIVHNVSKRHNIGTLVRSAAAFGVTEVRCWQRKDSSQ